MKRLLLVGTMFAILFSSERCSGAWAKEWRVDRWDLRMGYAYQYTNNTRPNNFQLIPVLPSAVIPLTESVGAGWLRGRWEWNPELFLALFTHPYLRPLVGVTPLQFRYALGPWGRWTPYGFIGAGILRANINRRETTSDLNFNLQGGLGVSYAVDDALSLLLEYRHIHISNAGIDEDNAGMNTNTFLAGISLKR